MPKIIIILLIYLPIFTLAQNTFQIATLKYNGGGDWYANPTALPNLIEFANKNIGTNIRKDPATVEAQLDNQPVEVRAAVAALPTEALVSSQMETLLAGIDEGVTPAWARPALASVEQKLAQRGLSVSTVGRDALFNSIIQAAMPLAQSNATALQQAATQQRSIEAAEAEANKMIAEGVKYKAK